MQNSIEKKEKKAVLVSKDNSWAAHIRYDAALKYVEEGAASRPKTNKNTFRCLYTEGELSDYIIRRDSFCRLCKKNNGKVSFLIPESHGGIFSPVNLILCCSNCETNLNHFPLKKREQFVESFLLDNKKTLLIDTPQLKTCNRCLKNKNLHEFRIVELDKPGPFYCKKCINEHDDLFYILDQNLSIINVATFSEMTDLLNNYQAEISGPKSIKLTESTEKNKPIVSPTDALISIESNIGIFLGSVSISTASLLLHLQVAKKKSDKTIQFLSWKGTFAFIFRKIRNLIFNRKPFLLISKSGKWSSYINKKTKKVLIKENLVSIIQEKPEILQMNLTIEQFKQKVLKRDQYTCQICSKKGTGVYSEHKILTFSNSYCICLDCETKNDPYKTLKWINVQPVKTFIPTKCSFLYDKERNYKYQIPTFYAHQLLKEKMIDKVLNDTYILIYDMKDFKKMILKRDGYKCYYCTENGTTIDHMIPKSKGGLTTPKNCVCCCEECNIKKGNQDIEVFLEFLFNEKE